MQAFYLAAAPAASGEAAKSEVNTFLTAESGVPCNGTLKIISNLF